MQQSTVSEDTASPVTEAPPPPRSRPPLHFLQGLLMGTADVVPGVSGGTIALIVGIYERLIEAVRAATSLPLAVMRPTKGRLGAALRDVEWRFILPLGLGIVTAIIAGARTIPPLMEQFPVESRALFFGLVAASLIIPWQRAGQVRAGGYALAIGAAILAFVLVGLPIARTADPSLIRVFASAAVAICAMILPGVSGAFLLKVLGIYEPSLNAVAGGDFVYIAVFLVGAATGISLFARLLSYLLDRHHTATMVVLVGLLAGSLRALWPWQGGHLIGGEMVETPTILLAPPSLTEGMLVLAIAAVGFAIVSLLTWFGNRKDRLPQ